MSDDIEEIKQIAIENWLEAIELLITLPFQGKTLKQIYTLRHSSPYRKYAQKRLKPCRTESNYLAETYA